MASSKLKPGKEEEMCTRRVSVHIARPVNEVFDLDFAHPKNVHEEIR